MDGRAAVEFLCLNVGRVCLVGADGDRCEGCVRYGRYLVGYLRDFEEVTGESLCLVVDGWCLLMGAVLKLVWFVRWFHVEYEDVAAGYDAMVGWVEALRGCGGCYREIFDSYVRVCSEMEVVVGRGGDVEGGEDNELC